MSEMLFGFPWPVLAAWLTLTYLFVGGIYRLYLSPLSRFPGPKLAALTLWYEFYYDVVKTGQYMFEIQKMHHKYGPIVRINPYELHVSDPDFYEELYAGGGRKRHKYSWFTRLYVIDAGTVATVDHDVHRVRRASVSSFFSKANVRKLEPIIHAKVAKLLDRMRALENSKKPTNLALMYSALTSDIIAEYAYGKSHDNLNKKDYNKDFFEMMDGVHHTVAISKQFGFLMPMMLAIPPWITRNINKGAAAVSRFQDTCRAQIIGIMADLENNSTKESATIFHDILRSNLRPEEKQLERLWQEGQTVVVAGTETTAWALAVITFHLLQHPPMLRKLREELLASKVTTSTEMEKLPYLTGVIQEGLRLSFGVCTRLPRIAPDEVLQVRDREILWDIPRNTPVSMSAGLMHLDPRIFPDPKCFKPERWINNKGLDRYLVSFTKGSRQCVGINLAYSELYICLNAVFSRYGSTGSDSPTNISLYDTTEEDVELRHDLFVPGVKKGSEGIRVLFYG
ncbi:cytochrome P450 monooxygenase [Bisporella sp. PMI_857]|nr:cytochrome P450 monooxygenase [Bisporella sp. PMI_857]